MDSHQRKMLRRAEERAESAKRKSGEQEEGKMATYPRSEKKKHDTALFLTIVGMLARIIHEV